MANLNGLTVNDSGFLGLPSGTTAERPASPDVGYVRYNTDFNSTEVFDGDNWLDVTTGMQSGLILDGLVLALDAANDKSYPNSGSIWADLSGYENNGTLENGVDYTNINGGALTFDGSNDYVPVVNPINDGEPYTILMMLEPDTLGTATFNSSTGRRTPLKGNGDWNPGIWVTQNTIRSHATTEYRDTNIDWSDLRISYVGMIFDGSTVTNIFDAQIQTGLASSYSPGVPSTILLGAETGGTNSFNWDGKIYTVHYYNRALSGSEIQQNFDAFKGRYGF